MYLRNGSYTKQRTDEMAEAPDGRETAERKDRNNGEDVWKQYTDNRQSTDR